MLDEEYVRHLCQHNPGVYVNDVHSRSVDTCVTYSSFAYISLWRTMLTYIEYILRHAKALGYQQQLAVCECAKPALAARVKLFLNTGQSDSFLFA
jgi:poly-beta-hydroxyalkanoate depolymerase